MFDFEDKLDLGPYATFVPNKNAPLYNWLYYKEGYSKEIVEFLAKEFGLKEGNLILDPFCGVGTTLIAAKELGLNSIGFDVNTVALFAAKAKCPNYDVEKLKDAIKVMMRARFSKINFKVEMPVVNKAFSKYTLEDIYFFKKKILEEFEDEKVRDFLILALINTSTKCTYAEKQGGCITINKKRHIPPFRPMFRKVALRMIKGYERFVKDAKEKPIDLESVSASVQRGDARQLPLEENSVDAIITSPPYLNKIEYTNVYAIEQYLFFGQPSRPAVRSFIGEESNKATEDVFEGKHALPEIAKPYFYDMNLALQEMYRVLKKDSYAGIVIGNGCFPEQVVQSDELLAELAEKAGFTVEKILVLNKRWCMKDRVFKVGTLRESLLILGK